MTYELTEVQRAAYEATIIALEETLTRVVRENICLKFELQREERTKAKVCALLKPTR